MLAAMALSEMNKIEGKITAARLAIGFERLWAALLWPVLMAGVFLALIFSGLMPALPVAIRLALAAILLAAFLWSLRPLLQLSRPTRQMAMRRIEAQSELAHRPVSGHDDQLAADNQEPRQQAIWQEHQLRQLRQLENLRIGTPRSIWRQLDGRALRVPVGLALLASLALGPGGPSANFKDALALAPPAQIPSQTLDAWLKPPSYTARAPIMLTSPAMVERLRNDAEIFVPENSVLTLRLSGATAPRLSFADAADANSAEITGLSPATKLDRKVFQADTRLTRPVLVKLIDGNTEIASWRIMLVPDAIPTMAISEMPMGDPSGTLTVKWKATDDYGVTAIISDISLADEQDDGFGIDGNGIFLYDAPKFPVALRKASPKEEAGSTSANLAEHPWAGFMVDMVLTASDAAGHKTASEVRRFRLPGRLFVKPMAKALIEQRRHLIVKPQEQGQVAQMLAALVAYPDGLIEGSGDYLAIAAIISRLNAAASQDDVDQAVKLLWQTAVGIEDGSMAGIRAELEALRRELEKALAEAAPPERIAELMDKLRNAMDRYMQSLLEETGKRMRQGKLGQNHQQGKMLTPGELNKMLDMIGNLAQSGANDAARQMLSQLDEILRNMQPGTQSGQMQQQRDGALSKMLDQLSGLMRKQQQLMDETQRMQRPGEDGPGDRSYEEQANPGIGALPDALAGRQNDLGEMLRELMRQLGQNGLAAPPTLGEAGENMKGAEGSLRQGDRDSALDAQGEAIAKLREGAQGMAEQLMQQGQGQQGSEGRHGEARGDGRDPLGRPEANRGEDTGPENPIVPSELALRRAREILETLRSRANELQLPKLDRDYIDRLLRGLY